MSQRQWMRIATYARSDVGRVRAGNEDDYYVGETVVAVADGMGGHVAGEVAAKTALEPIAALDGKVFTSGEAADEALVEAVREANRQVVSRAEAEPDLKGMGTTLTAGMIRDGRLHVAHVGDSRAYLLRGGAPIEQLTTDHTLVERLVREGRLSRDEAALHPQRNVITRAIGNEPDVVVDSLPPIRLEPGDEILLCSDGLTGPVGDEAIGAILAEHDDGETAVTALVDAANDAGGPDNITVVLLRVSGDPEAASTAEELDEQRLRRIRTREDTDRQDWASTLGRFGAPQGVATRPDETPEARTGRGRRVLAGLVALGLLLGVLGGGGYVLLSRAYFIGEHEGQLAIFQGLPQEVGTVPLNRVIDEEVSDVAVEDFPEWRQDRIRDGITAGTIVEARRRIDELESTLSPGEATPTREREDSPARGGDARTRGSPDDDGDD
ncbi:MAG: Stp1/IreP family PP2C-type Ser/Thr phosphatase [Actinomycetota bacterium]